MPFVRLTVLLALVLLLLMVMVMVMCSPTQYISIALAADDDDQLNIVHSSSASDLIITRGQERAALIAFKASISADPLHALASWDDATNASSPSDPCRDAWAGIACDAASRIVSLQLPANNLSGTIPFNLYHLPFLSRLNLSINNLSGPIPPELGRLSRLTRLDFKQNQLSGPIPPQLSNCSLLYWLDLSHNLLSGSIPPSLGLLSNLYMLQLHDLPTLTGAIPPELGDLSNLTYLYLGTNNLTGSVPPQLGKLSKLKELYLIMNQLQGAIPPDLHQLQNLETLAIMINNFAGGIPPQLGNLKSLKHLWAFSCNLSGPLPPQLGNLSNLIDLDLSSNHLSGPLPPELGRLQHLKTLKLFQMNLNGSIPVQFGNLTSLQDAFMFSNSLSGHIPPALGKLENLQNLYLYFNKHTGLLPAELGDLKNLQNLLLFGNELDGEIPPELGKLKNLVALLLGTNGFSGIPSTFGNLENLQYLDVSTNKMNREIPSFLGNLSNLIYLDLSNNRFSCGLPAALADCTELQWLKLGNNSLNGEFPTTFSSLRHLHTLSLAHNNMTGALPASFANQSSLVVLDLRHNRFHGTLPDSWIQFENLRVLSLGYNRLTGLLPSWIPRLNKIQLLDLSNNNFSGTIPKQMYHMDGLKIHVNITGNSALSQDSVYVEAKGIEILYNNFQLVVVTSLDLSGNRISGNIPEDLGSLNGLYNLNLSRNLLTGAIPTSLGNIHSLESLDLSSNALIGPIPAQLLNLTYLAVLDLSYNHLSGPIPRGKQLDSFSNQSYLNNTNLCGFPLTLSCSELANAGHNAATSHVHTIAKVKIIASCIAATVGIGAIAFVVLVVCMKRLKRMGEDKTHVQVLVKRHTLHPKELFEVTNGYCTDNIIGQGGVSTVYKGVLRDGTVVAVKKFKMLRVDEEEKSFKAECTTLGKIRHRNLVRVLGACVSKDIKALILEFVANGNLDTHLYEDPCKLDWNKRFQIALGVAHGLFYLHNDTGFGRVLHCDLKPSNILLDADFEPHIGDFGIARLITPEKDAASASVLRGSFGYMAPELAYGVRITDKVDVYSYGVFLLELLTRRRPNAQMFDADKGESLVGWVQSAYNAKDWRGLIDSALSLNPDGYQNDSAAELSLHEVYRVLNIALFCVNHIPKDRPSMRDVLDVFYLLLKKRKAQHLNMGSAAAEGVQDSPVSDSLPLM